MARKSRKAMNQPVNLPEEQKKTAIYIRLSREDYEKKGDSLENQKQIALDHLLTIPELGIPVVYEDNGFTGRNTNRPQFQQMIEDIENGLIEAVIVKDLSRISRNSIDSGYYLDRFFPTKGIRFIAVTDMYDSALDVDGSEGAIIPIKIMLNEAHSLDLGKKIKSVKQKSMRDGDCISSVAPYGYKKSKDNHYKLEIDEVSSKVVKEIFERTLQGEKIGSIVRIFNDRMELSPLDYNDYRRGKVRPPEKTRVWGNHSIEKILTSEVYIGNLVQGRCVSIEGVSVKKDSSEWIKTENTHEPIISVEMFEEAQIIVEKNKKPMERKTHKPNIYVNKLFCGDCGKPMSRCTLHRQKGTIFKYKCKSNYLVRKGYCKSGFDNIIWEEELENIVCKAVDWFIASCEDPDLGGSMAELLYKNGVVLCEERLQKLSKEITNEQYHLKSLYENLVEGVINQQDYLELKLNYERNILGKKYDYVVSLATQKEAERRLRTLESIIVASEYLEFSMTKEIVEDFIGKIYIYGDKSAAVNYAEEELNLVYIYEPDKS